MNAEKLDRLENVLEDAGIAGLTANEAYAKTGIMRSTLERYFEVLKQDGKILEIKKGPARIRIHKKAAIRDLRKA